MRLICQLLLLLMFALVPAHAGHKPQQIFLRVHIQTPGEGLPSSQVMSLALPPNGEPIQVNAIPEVSEKDIFDVKTDSSGTVFLFLNHRGKVNLDAGTGQNIGRIMVVILNGYVIYAPVIDQQITNGVLAIPHPLSAEAIKVLQDMAKQNVKDATVH